MNCRQCQRDMSQCLDGRLPSGRRATVMQHLETCEECNQLWREFQQAQELILRLPVRKVSADFQDKLWDRIKAGEGTPQAVFNEPMPIMAKARYVFTGAAAAALLIVLLNVWDTGGGPTTNDALPELRPLAPTALAEEAARVVARDSRRLNDTFRTLQRLPQGRLDESTFQVILESAEGVKSVGELLLTLQEEKHVELLEDMDDTLSTLASRLDVNQLRSTRDVQTLLARLRPVIRQLQRLELLPGRIMVRFQYGLEEQQDFQRQVWEIYRERRALPRYIRIEVFRQPLGPSFRLDPVQREQMYILPTHPDTERK